MNILAQVKTEPANWPTGQPANPFNHIRSASKMIWQNQQSLTRPRGPGFLRLNEQFEVKHGG